MHARSRISGFTLIELMITILVFSILTGLAVPTLRVWIGNTRVRAVADALQNGIRLAQTESLRRSRQIVFSLTNSTAPATSLTASANGGYWSVNAIPSLTDGSEGSSTTTGFIESGVLSNAISGITVTGPAEICFNSVGRLVANASTGVSGSTCALPTTSPPVQTYNVTLATTLTGSRPLRVTVSLGGQVRLCDPAKTLSSTTPDGC